MSAPASALLLGATLCLMALTGSLEAIALPVASSSELRLIGAGSPPDSRPRAGGSGGAWIFRMEPATAAATQQPPSPRGSGRWKRGAEMALLLAHICRQYKAKGVQPPARYKCQ